MRIGIDATLAAQENIVGISRFVVNLIAELAHIPSPNRYDLFYRPRALTLRRDRMMRFQPTDPRFATHLLAPPFTFASMARLDVYYGTYQWLPRYCGRATIVGTLHDIVYLSRTDLGSQRTRARAQARYRDVAARSKLIVTLSQYSKDEIVRLLGVDPGRVRIVPLAAEAHYVPQPAERIAEVRLSHGLEQPYILFAGGFGRRKNAAGAVRAFARALPDLPADVCLAISGGSGPLEQEVRDLLGSPELAARVHLIGYVADENYPALMSGCLAFFLPTLLEGFGLPALEAMACGAAVVTSSTTSVPEVCGDAALLVDPEDEAALASALVRVCGDTALRERLGALGLERAKLFSWSQVAETMLAIWGEAADLL
jgi:glycosyltransferase involved in cell wall biosynthesis